MDVGFETVCPGLVENLKEKGFDDVASFSIEQTLRMTKSVSGDGLVTIAYNPHVFYVQDSRLPYMTVAVDTRHPRRSGMIADVSASEIIQTINSAIAMLNNHWDLTEGEK